ncbi:MAG: DUF2066 domain-containing protein [Hyphomicrobiales bacterium]|nr:DUF2066 domain-containing protein [Hyphomicrobiales bacterium]
MRSTLIQCFCLFLVVFWAVASLAEEVYVVNDVRARAEAENAEAAREQAVKRAEAIAFERLTQRLVPVQEVASIPEYTERQISDTIISTDIRDEKISSQSYDAVFDIRFNPEKIQAMLARENVDILEDRAPPLLVLPWIKNQEVDALFSMDSVWMEVWRKQSRETIDAPLLVPFGDLTDRRLLKSLQENRENEEAVKALLTKYHASGILWLEAQIEEALMSEGNELDVALHSLGDISFLKDKDWNFIDLAGQGNAILMQEAAATISHYVEDSWQQRKETSNEAETSINLKVPLENLQNWMEIKKRLDKVEIINAYDVLSLAPGQADVLVKYHAKDPYQLLTQLDQVGLRLMEQSPGEWFLYTKKRVNDADGNGTIYPPL